MLPRKKLQKIKRKAQKGLLVSWRSFEENASQIKVQNFLRNIDICCTLHRTLHFISSANVLLDNKYILL